MGLPGALPLDPGRRMILLHLSHGGRSDEGFKDKQFADHVLLIKQFIKTECENPLRGERSRRGFLCIFVLDHTKMISRPTSMPMMAEKAGSLLWYIRMAWGRISPKTTYSMAPLAKPRLRARPIAPMSPSR